MLFKKRKPAEISGVAGLLLVVILLFGYCYQFRKEHGLFSASVVGFYNQYYILRKANLIHTDEIGPGNENLRNDLNKTILIKDISVFDEEILPLARKYGYASLNSLTKNSICNHPQEYLTLTAERFEYVASQHIFSVYANVSSKPLRLYVFGILYIFNTTFRLIYFFLIAYGICLACYSVRRKQVPVLSCLMWMTAVCHIFSIIVGAQAEWGRLAVPCIPVLIVMAGQFAGSFHIRKKGGILLP